MTSPTASHPLIAWLMEIPGQSSRWNTLRALRVLRNFEVETPRLPSHAEYIRR